MFFRKLFKVTCSLLRNKIDKVYTFSYTGQGVSSNDYYAQQHWTQRNNTKKKYSKIAESIIGETLTAETKIDTLVVLTRNLKDADYSAYLPKEVKNIKILDLKETVTEHKKIFNKNG